MRLLIFMTTLIFILAACSGKEARIEKYYQSGESHYLNSNCTKAKLEYKNVLQIDPNHAPAYVGLGKCLLDQQIYVAAYANFMRALTIDENNIEARIFTAKLFTLSQRDTDAKDLLQEILLLDPVNASAIALRGFIKLRSEQVDAALTDAELALAAEPNNLEAITLKSLVLVKQKRNLEVSQLLEEVLLQQQLGLRKSKELRMILAALYEQVGQHADTVRIYQSLVEDFPDEIPYINALARQYANNKQPDEARNIYLMRLEDDYHPDIILEFISFLIRYEDREEAFELLKAYAEEEKITGKVRLALAREYIYMQQRDEAVALLHELAANKNIAEQMEATNEIAFLHIKEGDDDQALTLANEVLSEQPNNIRALIMRAKLAKAKSNYSQSIADLRVVVRLMPNNLEAIKELAQTYVFDDQPELAKKLIVESYENNAITQELAEIYVGLARDEAEVAQAIELMRELYQTNKTSVSVFSTLFNLYLVNKEVDQAKNMLAEMDPSLVDTSLATYHAALLDLSVNDLQQAIVNLNKTIAIEQRSDAALRTLIEIYMSNDNKPEAIRVLQNTIAADQEYILPYIMLADILVTDRDFKTAQMYLEKALVIDPQATILYQRLATIVSLEGGVDEGIAIIKKGFEVVREPETLGVDLALSQYRIGHRDDAITTLDNLLTRLPDSIMIKTQLAYMLADEQSDDLQIARALALIEQVEDSELVQVQGAVGWIKYKMGNYNQAIVAYKRALKQSPDNAELNYQLGIALMDSGSNAEAEIFLARAANADQNFKDKQDAVARLGQLRTN